MTKLVGAIVPQHNSFTLMCDHALRITLVTRLHGARTATSDFGKTQGAKYIGMVALVVEENGTRRFLAFLQRALLGMSSLTNNTLLLIPATNG